MIKVKLLDRLIGRYKIPTKWYLCLFYHLCDMAVINSWLLFKSVKNQESSWRISTPKFPDGIKKQNSVTFYITSKNVRTDAIGYWLLHGDKRCKLSKNLSRCSCYSFLLNHNKTINSGFLKLFFDISE